MHSDSKIDSDIILMYVCVLLQYVKYTEYTVALYSNYREKIIWVGYFNRQLCSDVTITFLYIFMLTINGIMLFVIIHKIVCLSKLTGVFLCISTYLSLYQIIL